jgi:hypothetical protein
MGRLGPLFGNRGWAGHVDSGWCGPTVFLMGIAAEYAYIIRNIGLFEIAIEFPKKEILMA